MTNATLQLAPWQHAALQVPEEVSLMLAGGKAGGKSHLLLLAVVRHCELHGEKARPLILRETHPATLELGEKLDALLAQAYGNTVRRNKTEKTWHLPNGAIIEIGQCDGPQAVKRFAGRSFTLLCVDEFGHFREKRWIDQLKASLRSDPGIPLRTIYTANPAGTLHTTIAKQWLNAAPPWEVFEVDGERFIWIGTTLWDNPFIDHADYAKRLEAATSGDPVLLKAWRDGDWSAGRGSFFGDVWDPRVHIIAPITFPLERKVWRPFLSMDWGSARPCATLLCARAPGEGFGPWCAGSLIVVDEVATYDPSDPTRKTGLRWPASKVAEEVLEKLCRKYGARPVGVGDDAAGFEGKSLLEALRAAGLGLSLMDKKRVAGWQRVRQLLNNSVTGEGPGLYVSSRCSLLLDTLPTLPRDPRRLDDVDTNAADDAADALRGAVMYANPPRRVQEVRVIGRY
jgi:hypothetical protein